jgi:hypothetical protein
MTPNPSKQGEISMKLTRIAQQQALEARARKLKRIADVSAQLRTALGEAETRTEKQLLWRKIKSVFFLRKSVLTGRGSK